MESGEIWVLPLITPLETFIASASLYDLGGKQPKTRKCRFEKSGTNNEDQQLKDY